MLTVLSPAKNLDYTSELATSKFTQPQFMDEAQYLMGKLRKLSKKKIASMMSLSANLTDLNHERYQTWNPEFELGEARQAALAFNGEVYWGLEAKTFSDDDFEFSQDHLRILSGLHGLLRPLDLIKPYRLEMGTRWDITPKTRTLYKYWGNKITDALNETMAAAQTETLVNLASNEYFKVVQPERLKGQIITCHFKEMKNGEYKALMTYAKRARGTMAAYLIKNRIIDPSDIKGFNLDNYQFNEALSTAKELVFTRG